MVRGSVVCRVFVQADFVLATNPSFFGTHKWFSYMSRGDVFGSLMDHSFQGWSLDFSAHPRYMDSPDEKNWSCIEIFSTVIGLTWLHGFN